MYPHKYNITCKHGLPIYYLKNTNKTQVFFLVCLLFSFGLVRLQNVQQMMQHDNCKMYVCIYNVCMYVCMYMYVYVCIYIVLCMHIMLASTSILVAESCSNSFTMLILIIFAVCNQSVLPRYSVTNMLQTGLIFPLHPPLFSYNNPTKCHNAYPGSYVFLNM